MTRHRRCTATRAAAGACAFLVLLLAGSGAHAGPVGTVTVSTGPLLARAGDQTLKVLVTGSSVSVGETVFTRADTYSQIQLGDNSSMGLGPDSELTIEQYSSDSTTIRLVNGRVRIAAGLPGTRGSNTFILQAGSATLTVQRGAFIAEYVQRASGDIAWEDMELRERRMAVLSGGNSAGLYRRAALRLAQAVPSTSGAKAPGLYVQVLSGMINLSNTGGSMNFGAGQFGYIANQQMPPVVLPVSPGMQFNPPPAFSGPTSNGSQNTTAPGAGMDCIVR